MKGVSSDPKNKVAEVRFLIVAWLYWSNNWERISNHVILLFKVFKVIDCSKSTRVNSNFGTRIYEFLVMYSNARTVEIEIVFDIRSVSSTDTLDREFTFIW